MNASLKADVVPIDASPVSIDLAHLPIAEHVPPGGLGDHVARALCRVMRFGADLFFRRRYLHRAVVLETVAAVPGMVGATLQHLRSLRVMRGRANLVKVLMDEAENERMHLMAFVEICQPTPTERLLILLAQGFFFNAFFLLYLASPAVAHRLVGYFEEEAVVSYTRFLAEIDAGRIKNLAIPAFARRYWNLPREAALRDLVLAVRADEAHHRDVKHRLVLVERSR